MNNKQVQEMAKAAINNWILDEETDPHGDILFGIEYIASDGEFEQDIIDANIQSADDWDALEEWAERIGQQMNR